MFRSLSYSLLTFSLLVISTLAAPIPGVQWTTPSTCFRGFTTYDFKQCNIDLNDLIRTARESIEGIEIIGRRLVDVIGPGAVRSNPP